jgi:hypothetical protein
VLVLPSIKLVPMGSGFLNDMVIVSATLGAIFMSITGMQPFKILREQLRFLHQRSWPWAGRQLRKWEPALPGLAILLAGQDGVCSAPLTLWQR